MPATKRAKTSQCFDFSAGPAILPKEVLATAQSEMLNYQGSGRSIVEMSHRGSYISDMMQQSEGDLRVLLGIPDTYAVMFLQGGATAQFSAIPLNLASPQDTVEYLVTGTWGKKAVAEAKKYTNVHVIATSDPHTHVTPCSEWKRAASAKYLHYTDNETVHGVEFDRVPDLLPGQELVCDMSSNFLSRPVDVTKFGLIYAGAQKNSGIAGTTIVIVKRSLLGAPQPSTPATLNYTLYAKAGSLYNTGPIFAIYMSGLVFKWVKEAGGIPEMQRRAEARAAALYGAIDGSEGFYRCPVEKASRSNMNVVFRIKDGDAALEKAFVAQAAEQGLYSLAGHRSVGGIRASIYNAMPMAGVEALIKFMQEFAAKHT